MGSKVIVTPNQEGKVITVSTVNPKYGYIRVEQTRMLVDEMGFAKKRTITALILGTIEDLKNFNWKPGQQVEGRIVIKESLNPFNRKDPDKDLKVAGSSNVICRQGDQPVYRKNFYSISETATDVLLEHTNGNEIRDAYANMKEECLSESALNDEFAL